MQYYKENGWTQVTYVSQKALHISFLVTSMIQGVYYEYF